MPKKRGNGEGSITKRPDGRWMSQVTVERDPNGKIKRKTFYGKTRQEVSEKLNKALVEIQNGTFLGMNKTTVGHWLDTWLEIYSKPKVRLSTWENYESVVRQHIKPKIGDIQLKDLRPEHLQKLYNEKLSSGRVDGNGGLSSGTVVCIHAVMNQALKQAIKEQLVIRNVAEAVSKPKQKHHEIEPLTIEQTNHLLSVAINHKHFPAFLLEWATGLRRGELLGLRWRDVDLQRGTITVRQSLIRTRTEGLTFSEPKTKKSRRIIPIPLVVIAELKKHKAQQAVQKISLGPAYKENDLVFCNEVGCPIDPRGFTKSFERVLKKASLPKIAFHDMRHGHATMLLLLGEHPKVVQERLGHSTISMTLDTYSHIIPGLQEKATQKLSSVLDIKETTSTRES